MFNIKCLKIKSFELQYKLKISNLKLIPIFISLFLIFPSAARAASLYFAPASGTYNVGDTVSVGVRVNTGGEAINAVSTYFTYSADKLGSPSIGSGGSFMTVWAERSAGGGSVRISGGRPSPGFSGDGLVAWVSFKVLTTGTASLGFSGGSAVLSNATNENVLSGTSTASYSLVPAPPPQPRDETPPKISDVTVSDIATSGATVKWTTDEEADSFVEYGLTDKYFLSTSKGDFEKEHSLTLDILPSGTTFHFRISSRDKAGNLTTGEDKTFTTLGYIVKIKVFDHKDRPVEGAEVSLYSEPLFTNTDKEGIATFKNVSDGQHGVVAKYQGFIQTQTIMVEEKQQEQVFELKFAETKQRVVTKTDTKVERISKDDLGRGIWIGIFTALGVIGAVYLVRVYSRNIIRFFRSRKERSGNSDL